MSKSLNRVEKHGFAVIALFTLCAVSPWSLKAADAYVESTSDVSGDADSGAVINTGYFMKTNSCVEIDFEYTEIPEPIAGITPSIFGDLNTASINAAGNHLLTDGLCASLGEQLVAAVGTDIVGMPYNTNPLFGTCGKQGVEFVERRFGGGKNGRFAGGEIHLAEHE